MKAVGDRDGRAEGGPVLRRQLPDIDPLAYQFELDALQFDKIDSLTSGACRGIKDFMHSDSSHADWLHHMRNERLQNNRPFTPGHASRLNRYLLQNTLLQENSYDMLREFPNREMISQLMSDIYTDEDKRLEYEMNHSYYDPITCKPSRYYGVFLAQKAILDKQDSFTHIDFGCGNNTGVALEHIASTPSCASLRDSLPKFPKLSNGSTHEKEILSATMTESNNVPLEGGWGIDIYHPWEPFVNQFGIACNPATFLVSTDYFDTRRTLIAHRETNPAIHFSRYDITEPRFYTKPSSNSGKYVVALNSRSESYKIDPLPQKVDIASAFYVLYMHNIEKRKQVFDNMAALGRLILVFDAITRIVRNKSLHPIEQLTFADYWSPYS
ncbi:MAG TPA: hypothetical protein PKD15_04610, partial [Candidatus Saccharibacteria bacterium]|nr:hypothetical protein [Candidatus Saccharibacteria bacterium]